MFNETALLICLQFLLVGYLFRRNRTTGSDPASVFAPVSWFLLFYVTAFLIPQIASLAYGATILLPGRIEVSDQTAVILTGQRCCCVFLALFSIGYGLVAERRRKPLLLRKFNPTEILLVSFIGLLGLSALCILLTQFSGDAPRSSIVKTTQGRILYSMTFWGTLFATTWSAIFFKQRQHLVAIICIAIFAYGVFLLGGRGRAVWPIVTLLGWLSICQFRKLSLFYLGAFAIIGLFVLQTLDPILLCLRGDDFSTALPNIMDNLSVRSLFVDRNIESFQNVAVITHYDQITPNPRYLLFGSQEAFMSTYFPSVAARGVGFPATLLGGLWMCGKWPAIIFGSFLFGGFFGLLDRMFAKMTSEFEVVAYCTSMVWMAQISTSYLDMYLKVASAIGPGLAIAFVVRYILPAKLRERGFLGITLPRIVLWSPHANRNPKSIQEHTHS